MPRLTPDLLPPCLHGWNLRTTVPECVWDEIRACCYQAAGYKCEICGGRGKGDHAVECHEHFALTSRHGGKQSYALTRLLALCPDCHAVKHIGRSLTQRANRGLPRLLKHIARVNDSSIQEAEQLIRRAVKRWEQTAHVRAEDITLDLNPALATIGRALPRELLFGERIRLDGDILVIVNGAAG